MAIAPLPKIMVAPNGARRTKADHPALPVTIAEIVSDAVACHRAGAEGLHAHVRDDDGRHVLDAGLYRELIAEMDRACPRMLVQITTEAVGRYRPEEQRAVVREVRPPAVSVALVEMMTDPGDREGGQFYHWAAGEEIALQHILYTPQEVDRLAACIDAGAIPKNDMQLLFVLGRYADGHRGRPEMLDRFLDRMQGSGIAADWAACAFGGGELACMGHALERGGKVRVGFENNLYRADGSPASANAEQIAEISRLAAGTA